jgi:nitrogen-specific signal transduction histidine kinase/ActR/RegA family two-component response regulator
VVGTLGLLKDIGERRRLEEQLRQSQKMEAVGRLAGGVAHDFNNHLTVIGSYSEMLLADLGPDDPRRSDLEEIRKAAGGAAALTRQLLAFSRQQVIEPRNLDLNEIVASSGKMLTRLIGEDIELVVRTSSSPVMVRMDAGQLDQVIMNLAVNSRDAMPGGGRLTIETAEVELDQSYAAAHWPAPPGRFAMLAVSDTGIGMDEQTRDRIFEPFYTTKESGKGTGLGLATVYGIVKQSRGFIWVYSEPGHGATFKIYLPPAEGPGSEAGARPAQPVAPRGTETILLVEDSSPVRAIARQILQRQGYRVLEAPGGDAALALAGEYRPAIHLLLTDVIMPGMSGRQLAERLQAMRPETRVLFMSGYTDDAVVLHAVLEENLAYLQKPFSPDSLARKVREVLDKAGA